VHRTDWRAGRAGDEVSESLARQKVRAKNRVEFAALLDAIRRIGEQTASFWHTHPEFPKQPIEADGSDDWSMGSRKPA